MDFSISEEQQAISDLTRQIFRDRVTHERLMELERGDWYDLDLWADLAQANLPGVALPESVGGSGLGLLEVCAVLEEQGRAVAPVPLLPTLLLGGAPIAQFGSETQQRRWLTPVTEEGAILTAALVELGSSDPTRPRVTARRDGATWRLDGEKQFVPAAHLASAILVPAQTGDGGVGVFVIAPDAPGVELVRQKTFNHEPQSIVRLTGATVSGDDVLGDPNEGAAIASFIRTRALLGLSAIQLGAAEEAMQRTATYTTERVQFGRPIATFQGVALRIADAYVDVQAMRATLTEAAWRVSEGLPADAEVASAKWWACRAGQRVVNASQHLHGGIGADTEYPIHRFCLWSKTLELTLGGASQQLAELGSMLGEGRVAAL